MPGLAQILTGLGLRIQKPHLLFLQGRRLDFGKEEKSRLSVP